MLNSRPAGGMHLSNARHSGCFFGARHFGRSKATCLAATKQSSGSKSATKLSKNATTDVKEAHRIFDEAFITVKSGDGGNGEIVQKGKGRWVPNNKYQPGGQQPKKIWLPASDPADGSDGADVVLVVDPSLDNLVHLHARKHYNGPKGANANPAAGSGGPKANRDLRKRPTPPFEIPVPPGTVVKRKSNGLLLGDLTNPGDRLVVAYGGRGGLGLVAPSREQRLSNMNKQFRHAQATQAEVIDIQDTNWKVDSFGAPGQQLSLQLLLRVVADVGIVGLPNAGKSSLLKALTKASPEVAPYPFTTLMPNLGVLASGGPKAVLADLPGLIEGAHTGRGLGRMFLRHLRRTRMIMHVVDCSMEDPATDYFVVREELRMYNPEYCARPHVVVLNKFDLPAASQRCDEVISALLAVSEQHCKDFANEDIKPIPPSAVVLCSAATGEGVGELNRALAEALHPSRVQEVQQRGAVATQVLRPLLPSAASVAAAAAQQQQMDEEALLAMGDSSWSGIDAEEEEADDEDQPAGPDPEDGWMLELSEKQLLKLLAQDEARCAAKEAAAAAAGVNPYADESTSPDGSISAPVGAQRALAEASTSKGATQESVTLAASSSEGVQGEEVQQASGSRGGLQGQGEAEEEACFGEELEIDLEDLDGLEEELTQEELDLLCFLREQEAAGVVVDEISGASGDASSVSGQREDSDKDEEAWLLGLSEEQLLEMADKEYQGSKSSSS
mmetsp:Transcript_22537/g.62263  ORF Transcript_22537/g.62263 Transcript_22537/m.62263 type:complete len:729 (-) Transcript_22537:171-2357(-)